tara:strand:- start:1181 stop:1930 length:750 start_codon:yes stop_codon:yes gene_type:complete
MKTFSLEYKTPALFLLATTSLFAADAVNFNANTVTKALYRDMAVHFLDSVPTISSNTSQGYTGQPVYCAFQPSGECLLSAGGYNDAGLKIRWNGNTGSAGDHASALFLFKKANFLNGLNRGSVALLDGNDAVRILFGYMNPGKTGSDQPVAEASLRLVIKDDRGYHISNSLPIRSASELSVRATQQVYYQYNPASHAVNEAGSMGQASAPSFRNIEFLGFRIDAVRGNKIIAGANVGVVEFSVSATNLQ